MISKARPSLSQAQALKARPSQALYIARSLVGAVVEIRDRVKDQHAEHAESHEFVLRGLSDVGAMAQQASDVARAMTKIMAPLTDAVNRTMGAVQTTAGAINSHTLTLQSHLTAIQSMRTGIQDVKIRLADVHDSINGMQAQMSALSNPSPSLVLVLVAGNNPLIHTQHPSNSLPAPKCLHGNGTCQGNHGRGTGTHVAPIIVQDSPVLTAASSPVLCPPLTDAQSQTVVFTVTCGDQDLIETSRCVAAAIPGVGVGAITHARPTTVASSALLQFCSQSTATAFVHLLHNHDSVAALGASAGFAAYTPSNQNPDSGLNNMLNILSHPIQGN
ncbi:uncharacterized protein EV420DRAFT_1734550 [Desarmillaria tabescens]|uniref:Uncharacterized protein n=1 Tax=Armillaria tabescens TaxID=1929756 RepID=A0AA39NB35_ARMTA|nr:uncharacterized protein EV420DRAFT_1734550 [Desarmillaria tabescens]KAK0462352.1 hypothetical protein EV420DRAFT_1734550 [Desarmillaria tabescens]